MTKKTNNIEDHGIIGDLHSAALVGINGSIDWYCYPHFNSPSIFAALLDDAKGGQFQICPAKNATHKQLYLPDTNVLITRFLSPDGVGELTDFMPVGEEKEGVRQHRLIRRVSVVRGEMSFHLHCHPAFDYARGKHTLKLTEGGAVFHHSDLLLALVSRIPLQREGEGVNATFTLKEGEFATFVLQEVDSQNQCKTCLMDDKEVEKIFCKTVDYWREWIGRSQYKGRWRERVNRSALVLKLLTFQPTGAIIAAPTCSLPEEIGGERNWDYRYTWIRDASFTLYALLRIGYSEEAFHFMEWLQARVGEIAPDGSLQTVYGIDGAHTLTEEVLDHLKGYKNSRPVRIGNGAYKQLQLDIYGELMDSVYLFNKYGKPISYDLWVNLRRLLNWVCDNWEQPDEGIWEVRGGKKHFVYSKMLCWVALDRGLRLADKRSFPADRDRWIKTRDTIYEEIMTKGWSESRQSFVQYYGSDTLDASCLLMPLVFFISPTDPRMLKTLDAIQKELVSDSLVFRYSLKEWKDGLKGNEGTFNICTFWLVEALTRAGRLEDARLIFEKMLGYANHLGLYAEETGPNGEALGNFPQAFTHLALISAAFNLDRTLGGR
ncbi:glycoside hydrolase family 15 protein [candidate division TA06 bacterium]|nr:glycoside hydrolase family 15 protein [candidate division TA06 bacterium]